MPTPNILGIGCAKCGTTSLAKLLSSHPEVSSPRKEMHYFDGVTVDERSFSVYCSAFQPRRYRIDFTPSYIMDRKARFLIRDWLGTDLHFVAILRNPVRRAYSHYCHAKRNWLPGSDWVEKRGYPVENLGFRQAIEAELGRMVFDPYHARHFSYFSKGLYWQQLGRWFDTFPRDRFVLLTLEGLACNPRAALTPLEEKLRLRLDTDLLQHLNAQSDNALDAETYRWLWERYEEEISSVRDLLRIDIQPWIDDYERTTGKREAIV
jgi:hypothetical protein